MSQGHLAWHETLEIHELVAAQSIGLMKMKKAIKDINNQELHGIYESAIKGVTNNLMELIAFYPDMPRAESTMTEKELEGLYAGDLLTFSKMSVRNYAIAITEAATPEVRKVFQKHLNNAIDLHGKVFNYMYKTGKYPAYDLDKLLKNDLQLARKALK
ncbi:spore coat protein [Evansella cellulosilytica]|uniref:Coat F domain protein n=1 Tax=Evansella cellulosilytica (strain ATCC 21833 / DSM 2522 / FERM P-1141 / JCM 9156 / N-4) TaxID=649639 RepID=E6TU96_EVAC2|nr:spore coat protein [Evansella cellulosilytica]ADU28556.1 Coat F domain protein [Evansella cellulosilytica DSM 2522]